MKVSCRLPQGAEYISCSSSGHHAEDTKTVSWSTGSLEADGEITFTVECMLRAAGSNQLEVQCLADREVQTSALAKTFVEAVADLTLEVIDPSGPVAVGQDMYYEVHVRNRGSKTADSIDVTAYFSNGIEPVSVEGGPHELKPGVVVMRTIPSIEMGRRGRLQGQGPRRSRGQASLPRRAELPVARYDADRRRDDALLRRVGRRGGIKNFAGRLLANAASPSRRLPISRCSRILPEKWLRAAASSAQLACLVFPGRASHPAAARPNVGLAVAVVPL